MNHKDAYLIFVPIGPKLIVNKQKKFHHGTSAGI